MPIAGLESLGLVASVLTLWVALGSRLVSGRIRRSTLLALVAVLGLFHLANLLEASGVRAADTIADQFSILVPFLWGLFLLETGRSYLSARLAASDEQVRFFLEAVPAPVAWLDAEGKLLGYSQAWAALLSGSAPGKKLSDVLPAPLPELAAATQRCVAAAAPCSQPLTRESATDADGRARHYRWCVRSWSHPDRPAPGVMVLLEDATAEVEAEEQRASAADELARTQRLAHVGQMAAGAAHDFNNFLQVIHGAMWELESEPKNHQAVTNVNQALAAAQEMTRALLRFGRDQMESSKTELVDLAAYLRDLRSPLTHALGRRHQLDVALPEGAVRVEGRPLRLQQAVLNLALNARDAMPQGGTIRITLAVEQGEAVLSVQDFGSGMSEDVRGRLFSPFFTTKGLHGSGLGLHVVQSVVQEQRGHVSVDSEVGRGSTFRLHLPLASSTKV